MNKKLQWIAGLGAAVAASGSHAATETVDVLVLYTADATQTNNGRDINARVAAYIEYANQAYENSDVDMRLRLVGAEELDAPYTYVDGNNLDALRNNAQVARLRQETGADLVDLLNLRQPVQGGFICGIGYVPPGQENSGEFYSNAPSLGFSLVGVDCGYSTFSHELGHNMGLGHSYRQNSEGGIFPWARGYGENGLFSTIMAYPQAFNTRNQVQQFSSPAQRRCEGRLCGVARNQTDGADSVTNLLTVASQISGFVATVNPGNDGGDGGGGDLPVCNKPELEGNLLSDGDFTSLSAWDSFRSDGSLRQTVITADCGRDYLLRVTDRSQFYGGPVQDITGVVEAGGKYRISAKLGIAGGTDRDNIRMAVELQDSNGTRFQYLPAVSVSSSELSDYSEAFTLDAGDSVSSARLLIYGPAADVDFYVDEVKLVRTDKPAEEPGLLVDEGFENGATGWDGYLGTSLYYSRTANEGNYGLLSANRQQWYSGPGFSAQGVIEPGRRYQASVDVYLRNKARSADDAQLWAYYVDNQGSHWQQLGGQTIATYSWHRINAEFSIAASGPVTQLRLHVMGPQPATRLYIDNLRVSQ